MAKHIFIQNCGNDALKEKQVQKAGTPELY